MQPENIIKMLEKSYQQFSFNNKVNENIMRIFFEQFKILVFILAIAI